MKMTPDIVVFIFLIQFLAYGIKGLIGFGNPLIGSPLLAMRLDNVVITPSTLILDCPVNAYIAWKNRHNFDWHHILPLLPANLLGVIPGALLLKAALPWIIKAALGAVVILLGVEMATRGHHKAHRGKDRLWVRVSVAFISGVCAGLFGINMILVAYMQRMTTDYHEFKGSICCLLFGENVFRLCTYLAEGVLTRDVLLVFACSLPAAVLSMLVAEKLAPRLDEEKLQKWAIVLFIFGGASIMFKSLVFHT